MGADRYGNTYYRERGAPQGVRAKRWVIYKGRPEASEVPPEWHAWLHYTSDEPMPEESEFHKAWVRPHEANQTFTENAYLPPGHALQGGKRAAATGDYEAWKPEESRGV